MSCPNSLATRRQVLQRKILPILCELRLTAGRECHEDVVHTMGHCYACCTSAHVFKQEFLRRLGTSISSQSRRVRRNLSTQLFGAFPALSAVLGVQLGSPPSRTALEHTPMVQNAVEHRAAAKVPILCYLVTPSFPLDERHCLAASRTSGSRSLESFQYTDSVFSMGY